MKSELNFTAIALIDVDSVVTTEQPGNILHVAKAAEVFEVVVRIVHHFNEFEVSATTCSTCGQTVDFIVRRQNKATVTDRCKADETRVVVIIRATVDRTASLTKSIAVDRLEAFNKVRSYTRG